MQPLLGKTAVTTGASSGVGLACAKALLGAGAEAILINGRHTALGVVNEDELAQLAVFLASPAAAKMTGRALSMTGGISAL